MLIDKTDELVQTAEKRRIEQEINNLEKQILELAEQGKTKVKIVDTFGSFVNHIRTPIYELSAYFDMTESQKQEVLNWLRSEGFVPKNEIVDGKLVSTEISLVKSVLF